MKQVKYLVEERVEFQVWNKIYIPIAGSRVLVVYHIWRPIGFIINDQIKDQIVSKALYTNESY